MLLQRHVTLGQCLWALTVRHASLQSDLQSSDSDKHTKQSCSLPADERCLAIKHQRHVLDHCAVSEKR